MGPESSQPLPFAAAALLSPPVVGAGVQVLSIVLFSLLGRWFPRDPSQPMVQRDLAMNLLNGAALYPLRLSVVAWAAQHLRLGLVDTSALPGPLAQGLVAFVLLDFARYWLHRAAHRVPLLWSFHRVHHGAQRLDPTTGLRMHAFDFVQLSALPILLFGVLLDTATWSPWVLTAVLGVGAVFDGFQHANLRMPWSSPWVRSWAAVLNNPHVHAWHHTADGAQIDGNYGNTLMVWDRWFGSDVTQPTLPPAFGVAPDHALRNDPVGWQLLRPARSA